MAFRRPRPVPRNVQACLLAARGDFKTSTPPKRSHSARDTTASSRSPSGLNSRRASFDLSRELFSSRSGDLTFTSMRCEINEEDLIAHMKAKQTVPYIVAPGSKFRRSLYHRRMSRKSLKAGTVEGEHSDCIEPKAPAVHFNEAKDANDDEEEDNSKHRSGLYSHGVQRLDHDTTKDEDGAPPPLSQCRRKTPVALGDMVFDKEANFELDSDHPEGKEGSRCTTPRRPKMQKQLTPTLPLVAGSSASNAKDAKEGTPFDSSGIFKYSMESTPVQSQSFSPKRARSPRVLPKIRC